jgi:succinate dehydrogenase/fumarate reductase cytochrome b subunit
MIHFIVNYLRQSALSESGFAVFDEKLKFFNKIIFSIVLLYFHVVLGMSSLLPSSSCAFIFQTHTHPCSRYHFYIFRTVLVISLKPFAWVVLKPRFSLENHSCFIKHASKKAKTSRKIH